MLKDFKKFILRGNVVDLAVAVVIGAAFGAIVTSLVKDLVTPLIAAIGGKPDFSGLYFTVHNSKFLYGDFINAIISFLIIASVIFFFVVQPLNKLMAHLNPTEDVDTPAERECPECLSAIPAAAARCKFCTAKSKPQKA
ncbi:MAG TPA: large conductance mechanosensitive channel protein MscL [Candidatus Saccharimonadales bacterium]|nr:large conductance mechanosensitive channel protein MscL [Candidatus Saccharimonadales bacterium]